MAPKIKLLASELTIYAVGTLRQQWIAWLREPVGKRSKARLSRQLKVDGSQVKEIDAAGLQLLLALRRSLAAQERSLLVINPSNVLQLACESLGVTEIVGTDSNGEAA